MQQAPRNDLFGGEILNSGIKRVLTKSGNRLQFVTSPAKRSAILATPNKLRIALIENTDEHGRSTILVHSEDGNICLSAPTDRFTSGVSSLPRRPTSNDCCVMDTSIKVGTRTYGAADAKLPSRSARIPFNGSPAYQEWKRSEGNVLREIRGNLTYLQTGDMTSVVSGTLNETIRTDGIYLLPGSLTSVVRQRTNTSNFGPHTQLNGSTRGEHFTGVVTPEYQGDLHEHHPES